MPSGREDYTSVLTDAVNDIAENGFDSAERVRYWQEKLRRAAERTMRSQAQMEADLKGAMASIYKRMVEQGGAAKLHPGVSRFTLDKLRPQLHAALERRNMASRELIKLNREQSIAKMEQRFAGWATSVPPGGGPAFAKVEKKDEIRKSLASLPYEERRLLIDQGHKLAANINATIAEGGNAIAAIWRSHKDQPGYDGRPEHNARDGRVFAIRGSWALDKGLMRRGDELYLDEVDQPAEKPFCRCRWTYLYNLRDLPDDMITEKGRAELKRVRELLAR